MTQAPPQAPAPAGGAAPSSGKGLCIAGMILGIVSCVLFCFAYLAIPAAIVGLALSIIGRGKSKAANAPTGMATAGIILSVIGLAIDIICGLILGSLFLGLIGMGKAMQAQMPKTMTMPKEALDLLRLFF
jgi:hypothetical protein